jgi:Domain of unknown function (DUF3482)/50S ribosome-binding GTPase
VSEFLPEFVVVGNVNQGKSSIVAALIEDGAVPIATYPGTTCKSARYSFRLGGQDLFTMVDTPGFQDARAALAWMRERSNSPGDRPAAVRAFVEAHDAGDVDGRFADEVRLLKPVTQGASIIYVVDASSRFQPTNEAEMEILRWTGQPAMALINQTRVRDHRGEWRPILEQFFNLVREFNAYGAGFGDRLDLLKGFREIRDEWRGTIDRAVAAMEHEWIARRHKSAQVIAELLSNALGHVEKRTVAGDEPPPGLGEELEKAYQDRQRSFEREARKEIERLYQHGDLHRDEVDIDLLKSDLFSEISWRLFGLERGQMARYGVAWGALIGGGVDAAVGGLSFLTGAGVGAVVGGLSGYFASTQVAKTLDNDSRMARLLFGGDTGRFLFKGPVSNPRYAWMLVDRAITHHHAIKCRSHARQDAVVLEDTGSSASEEQPRVTGLSRELRDKLNKDLMVLIKEARAGAITSSVRENLANHLDEALAD